MREQVSAAVSWHWATVMRLLRMTPPWVLLVPAAGAVVIACLNTFHGLAPYLTKDSAEVSSPLILSVGVVIAAWLAATRPDVYYKWLAVFALSLVLRELHFRGTNTGFYIAIAALLFWASYARDRLEPFFSNKTIVTLLMAVLWTYAVSKTFDRHLWDSLMTGGLTRDLFEENLEILGHLMFVALVVVSWLTGIAPVTAHAGPNT
jgi:hypothetical protein